MSRGERLRQALKDKNWSIDEFSRRSNVSHTTLHKFAAGRDVRLSTVEGIAHSLGVSVSWLAFGVEVQKMKRCQALRVIGNPLNPELVTFVEDVRRSCPELPIVFTLSEDFGPMAFLAGAFQRVSGMVS